MFPSFAPLVSAFPSRYTTLVIYDASLDELRQKVWNEYQ
jgi:hypothetical protein